MGFFEDAFTGPLFDSDYRQRRDIEALKAQLTETPTYDPRQELFAMHAQIEQLRLLCNTLVSVIETKQIATREELEVAMQQIDLLDGREDGKISAQAWRNAPRCEGCDHYLNPKRDACVYCGRTIPREGAGPEGGPYRGSPGGKAAPKPRLAKCAQCGERVPQTETFFTNEGALWCSSCYR